MPREPPDHDQAGCSLDQAVRAEPDERDRRGGQARADGDRKLDEVPRDAAPSEQAGPAHPPSPFRGGGSHGDDVEAAHRPESVSQVLAASGLACLRTATRGTQGLANLIGLAAGV